MTRDDIIRMAREATEHLSDADSVRLQGIVLLALDAGEQAERDRTARLVQDMQNELYQLRMTGGNT